MELNLVGLELVCNVLNFSFKFFFLVLCVICLVRNFVSLLEFRIIS